MVPLSWTRVTLGCPQGQAQPWCSGKGMVFGTLKRGGKVYTKVVSDTRSARLMPVIQRKISPGRIVYTDSYRNYSALDISGFHHERINHSLEFAPGKNYINGIENFWNQAKRVLRKYNGIPRSSFPLFLKEVRVPVQLRVD